MCYEVLLQVHKTLSTNNVTSLIYTLEPSHKKIEKRGVTCISTDDFNWMQKIRHIRIQTTLQQILKSMSQPLTFYVGIDREYIYYIFFIGLGYIFV